MNLELWDGADRKRFMLAKSAMPSRFLKTISMWGGEKLTTILFKASVLGFLLHGSQIQSLKDTLCKAVEMKKTNWAGRKIFNVKIYLESYKNREKKNYKCGILRGSFETW